MALITSVGPASKEEEEEEEILVCDALITMKMKAISCECFMGDNFNFSY